MIDVKDIEIKARGRWHGILTSLGVPESYLTGKHGPCLFCQGIDRWRWDNKDNNGTYICGQCGAGTSFQLVMKYLGINFKEALKLISEMIGEEYIKVDTVQNKNEMSVDDKKKMLNKIWGESTKLTGSDHVSKYLHSRGLVLQPDNVRYCPKLYHKDTQRYYPAMVAKIVDKNNIPQAIHRTYLDTDVAKLADIKKTKKMTPAIKPLVGCAIRLFKPKAGVIIICEGIETAIACRQLFDIPAWSCLSSTILQNFEPPEGIRRVIICGDNDSNFTGQPAAYKLAKKLFQQDFLVDVWLPERAGKDYADELWMSIKP